MNRILVLALTVLAAVALLAGPAAAQPYPPPPAQCASFAAAVVAQGQPFGIQAADDCWLPASEVTFTLFSEPQVLGTTTVEADGSFATQVTIPADTPPGEHTLRTAGVASDGSERVIDQTITVVAADDVDDVDDPADPVTDPGPTDRLVRTGLELTTGLAAAAALLGVGGAALYAARRRSRVIEE